MYSDKKPNLVMPHKPPGDGPGRQLGRAAIRASNPLEGSRRRLGLARYACSLGSGAASNVPIAWAAARFETNQYKRPAAMNPTNHA